MIYGVIGFILGGIIGGCVAGSLHGKEYQKKIAFFQKENKRLRKENRKLKNEELETRDNEATMQEIKTRVEIEEDPGDEEDEEEEEEEEEDFDFDDPFPEDDDIPEAPIRKSEKKDSDFYSMTKEEFEEDLSFRDSETFTYYQKDGIFVDSCNDKVYNPEKLLDKETLEKVKTTDEDYLYSGNDWEDKMYEIIVEKNDSFYRDVANAEIEGEE